MRIKYYHFLELFFSKIWGFFGKRKVFQKLQGQKYPGGSLLLFIFLSINIFWGQNSGFCASCFASLGRLYFDGFDDIPIKKLK